VLEGRMDLRLSVSKEGQVYSTNVDEKSPLQSPAVLKCATKRFRRMQLELPPPPAEPATPVPPAPGKPAEQEMPPQAIVHLDFVKTT
jgi:hypothetical protein